MYVIDLTHYLDEKGAIAPAKGPARRMADFLTAVVAHASDFDRSDAVPGPSCLKCGAAGGRPVDTALAEETSVVVWHCPACGTEGRISNWQRSFWDLSEPR
jgi:Zn ribbon nucleic-acid-binding protein